MIIISEASDLIDVTPNELLLNMWWKKIFCFALVMSISATVMADAKKVDETDSMLGKLQAQYNELSPKGKFVTGAAVGFVGSRLALRTVTNVVKIGAGAFIA